MDDIDFLSLDDVLFAHLDQIQRYGGDSGVRDPGLLESALAQPQATFGGQRLHAFPFEMAAAYLFHFVQNHPFVDGNKRTPSPREVALPSSPDATSSNCVRSVRWRGERPYP